MTDPAPKTDPALHELEALLHATPPALRQLVAEQVQRHAPDLATDFYEHMLSHPVAAGFLDHNTVKERLHGSMVRWLESLYAHPHKDLAALVAQQRHVGQVHARIHLPYHLVARGARQLKWRLIERLAAQQPAPDALLTTVRYVAQLMDAMLEAMNASYELNTDHVTRSDEAFRQQALGQNMGAERERQRSNLLEWGQAVLLAVYRHAAHARLPTIGSSDFGLWIVHKGSSIFEGTSELSEILRAMERLDQNLLPQLQDTAQGQPQWTALLGQLEEEIDAIKFQLSSLFERQLELENGRDALTRLLNRRFLPSVISREIQIANKQRTSFALLLIDIDFFKNVNDQHGHDAGDSVLQQVSTLLQNCVRGGDFVFRYGGEELLVLMVEATEAQALGVAEKIRQRMATTPFLIGHEHSLSITTSVGVALFDGHPDYQYLIRRADEALYRAKNAGRNQVCLG